MQKKYFIGIDVSKHTLDVAFIFRHNQQFTPPVWKQFANTLQGRKATQLWFSTVGVPMSDETIIVIENTGIYHRSTWSFFTKL